MSFLYSMFGSATPEAVKTRGSKDIMEQRLATYLKAHHHEGASRSADRSERRKAVSERQHSQRLKEAQQRRARGRGKAQAAGRSASSSAAAHRVAIPSLVDLEGVASDKFMEVVDTWPQSRVNILEQTRVLLSERFARLGSRTITRLEDLFAALRSIGKGEFGEVSKACVRAWDRSDRPVVPPTCVQYEINAEKHEIFLIVKTLVPLATRTLGDVPYAGHTADFDDWTGESNSIREVMIGRMLNLLVIHGATPHFPLIYEPFTTSVPVRNAFVMELAHMSFTNFLSSKMLTTLQPAQAVELIDVAILQLCDGLLCAHKHYDFRHNDFHTENAMMTFITDTTYTYKVGGSYYKIPNYGMCWKLIDFGMSASSVFDKDDIAHSVMHSPTLSVAKGYFDLTDHAIEFYDLLRLVTSAVTRISARPRTATSAALIDRLRTFVEDMREIARDSDKRGSLMKAADAFVPWENRSNSLKLARTTKKFSQLMRSGGLLERLFQRIGARFLVASGKPRGVVFDADISPFQGRDIVLEGIHDSPIVVRKPLIASASKSVSPTPEPWISDFQANEIAWLPLGMPSPVLIGKALGSADYVIILNDRAGNLYTLGWAVEQLSPSYIFNYFRVDDAHTNRLLKSHLLRLMDADTLPPALVPGTKAYREYEVAIMCLYIAGQNAVSSPYLKGPKFPTDTYFQFGVERLEAPVFPADTVFVNETIEGVIHNSSSPAAVSAFF